MYIYVYKSTYLCDSITFVYVLKCSFWMYTHWKLVNAPWPVWNVNWFNLKYLVFVLKSLKSAENAIKTTFEACKFGFIKLQKWLWNAFLRLCGSDKSAWNWVFTSKEWKDLLIYTKMHFKTIKLISLLLGVGVALGCRFLFFNSFNALALLGICFGAYFILLSVFFMSFKAALILTIPRDLTSRLFGFLLTARYPAPIV